MSISRSTSRQVTVVDVPVRRRKPEPYIARIILFFFSENFDKSVSNFLTSPSLNCDIMTNYSSSNWGQSTCDLWAHGYRYLRVDLRI